MLHEVVLMPIQSFLPSAWWELYLFFLSMTTWVAFHSNKKSFRRANAPQLTVSRVAYKKKKKAVLPNANKKFRASSPRKVHYILCAWTGRHALKAKRCENQKILISPWSRRTVHTNLFFFYKPEKPREEEWLLSHVTENREPLGRSTLSSQQPPCCFSPLSGVILSMWDSRALLPRGKKAILKPRNDRCVIYGKKQKQHV